MKKVRFNEDQALIMQIIEESGEEHLDNLAFSLRLDRRRLSNVLGNLQHKGYIRLRATGYGTVASLSGKGRKAVRLIWPELPAVRYR